MSEIENDNCPKCNIQNGGLGIRGTVKVIVGNVVIKNTNADHYSIGVGAR
jgi:hypothetical protein